MTASTTLERWFRYKAQANDEILAAMRGFDDAAPAREIAVRVLNHTYVVDRIFAAVLTGAGHGYGSANASEMPALAELSGAVKASDEWYIGYVSGLDEAQLLERIDFTFTDGEPGRMSREEMLLHVVIHGASHRGQVGWMLMEIAVATPAGDRFTSYLHKAEAATRRRPTASRRAVAVAAAGNGIKTAPPVREAPGGTPVNDGEAVSRLDALSGRMRAAVGTDCGLGRTLKFDLKGEGFIHVDGGSVSNEDKPADLTLTVTIDDLKALGEGRLSPTTAVMTGRLGVSDMGVALGLLGRMQELFAKMRPVS
ncbi:MAG: SCP2 sterol-binding domain-containing protein [Alphaproteobacteria bacterium]|nr:SCP2 sterol-binding domain-containing protein [Alphaproteobacteria bacterium]